MASSLLSPRWSMPDDRHLARRRRAAGPGTERPLPGALQPARRRRRVGMAGRHRGAGAVGLGLRPAGPARRPRADTGGAAGAFRPRWRRDAGRCTGARRLRGTVLGRGADLRGRRRGPAGAARGGRAGRRGRPRGRRHAGRDRARRRACRAGTHAGAAGPGHPRRRHRRVGPGPAHPLAELGRRDVAAARRGAAWPAHHPRRLVPAPAGAGTPRRTGGLPRRAAQPHAAGRRVARELAGRQRPRAARFGPRAARRRRPAAAAVGRVLGRQRGAPAAGAAGRTARVAGSDAAIHRRRRADDRCAGPCHLAEPGGAAPDRLAGRRGARPAGRPRVRDLPRG